MFLIEFIAGRSVSVVNCFIWNHHIFRGIASFGLLRLASMSYMITEVQGDVVSWAAVIVIDLVGLLDIYVINSTFLPFVWMFLFPKSHSNR